MNTKSGAGRPFPAVFLLFFSLCCFFLPFPSAAQTKPDALVLYRQQQYAQAIEVCLGELEADSTNTDSYVVLCWALVKTGRYAEAENWAARGRGVSRYDPRLIEIAAEARYFQGKNEGALSLFQEYISYAPNGSRLTEAYDFMGEIFMRLGKYRHADIAFSASLQYDRANPARWIKLGYAREMALDFRYSLDAYNQALQMDPNNPDAARGRNRVIAKMN